MQVFSKRKDKPSMLPFLRPRQDPSPYVPFQPIEFSISTDGQTWNSIYDQPDLNGVLCYQHQPAPAKEANNYKKRGLYDGQSLVSTSFDQRDLTMNLVFIGMNENDMYLALDALQRFIVRRKPVWIAWEDWPQRMYYVKALIGDPTYTSDRGWTVQVTLTDQFGLSRSIGTTLSNGSYLVGFGNNQPVNTPQYIFNASGTIQVNNLSDIMVDPERRGHYFKMTINGSSSDQGKITNQTTGAEISFNTAWNGTFVLDGVNPIINGEDSSRKTNTGCLNLESGVNDITFENISGTVEFDYAMWWLS